LSKRGIRARELAAVDLFLQRTSRETAGYCIHCGYCLPCPQGINLPDIMACVYDARILGLTETARRRYRSLESPRADSCIRCGECEERCTQSLPLMTELQAAALLFGE
jgi:predicted aldo/keto reductase-like oxidoreductase